MHALLRFTKGASALFILIASVTANAQLNTPTSAQTDTLYDNAEGMPITSIINKAKRTIDIEIYEMDDMHVIQALENAVARGVRLRIVQDGAPLGVACKIFDPLVQTDPQDCQIKKKFVAWVRQHKGSYEPYNTKALCSPTAKYCYEHGKILIADSSVALISTGNFNPSNFCDYLEKPEACNRDYTIMTRDKNVLRTLGYIFEFDLKGETYNLQQILSTPMAARITVSPFSLDPIIKFIQSAKTSIMIQNQYLNDPTMNAALIDAAKRGVKIYMQVSSVCYFQKPDAYTVDKWTRNFTAFDQAGIQSRMFTEKMKINNFPGYLHAKAILIDGNRLWVGSVNGSTQSLTVNREFGLFMTAPQTIKKFVQKFTGDFKNAYAVNWQDSLNCKYDSPALPSPSPTPARH
ncbi:MAG: phosphatidylserine/phosphatidylglycerophosphate/cardiolipin synthase family protein [Bdellovibrionales bacterium]|nr:phosphatidylserine/phosphatidylglycerophosphate/cardiolipin synthase family protein [Bdellovibrionales bacterium]